MRSDKKNIWVISLESEIEDVNMATFENLEKKLETKSAIIGVIGLGYVGLPLALRYSEAGYKVIGFDVDSSKIKQIGLGKSYIEHILSTAIAKAVQNGFMATTDFTHAKKADALIICVPTPLNKHREPDLSFIIKTIDGMLPHLREGQIVSLESTTYPGTTEEELLPRIESTGLKVGESIFLVYSPEREDPGNADYTTKTTPKVCGGVTKSCMEMGIALYGQVIDEVVPVSSTRVAEMTKLLENIHRAVNIALVNELKLVTDRMNLDIFEVIRAASTKPFGFTPFHPGPGLGGHCIPIDPFYLTWKAREYGITTRFIELAGEVNTSMPNYVVAKVSEALNHHGKPVKGSKILILGIAYKKNVADTRESPSMVLMEELMEKGAAVSYSDPHVSVVPKMRAHNLDLASITIDLESLADFDCVVVATAHDAFDWQLIRENAGLIVDSRGIFQADGKSIWRA